MFLGCESNPASLPPQERQREGEEERWEEADLSFIQAGERGDSESQSPPIYASDTQADPSLEEGHVPNRSASSELAQAVVMSDKVQVRVGEAPWPLPEGLDAAAELDLLSSAPEPWQRSGVLAVDLYQGRYLFHHIEGGPAIDLGRSESVKYIQGRWRAPWLAGEFISPEVAEEEGLVEMANRAIVWGEGAASTIRFPVPAAQTKEDWVLCAKLRPKSPNHRVDLVLNDQSLGIVELKPRWQTVQRKVKSSQMRFGEENKLLFLYAGSYFEGSARVNARYDWVRLVPESQRGLCEQAPETAFASPLAKVLTKTRPALALATSRAWDGYFVLPDAPALRFYVGPAKLTQTPTPFRVWIEAEGGQPELAWEHQVLPQAPWIPVEIELGPYAQQAVRLRFEVLEGGQGSTEGEPAVFLAEPQILSLSPGQSKGGEGVADRVVLIAIDALRADRLMEGSNPAVPVLNGLVEKGVRLEALSQGPGGIISTVALLTGSYGHRHGVLDNNTHLKTSHTLIAEQLAAEGWETALFTTNPFVKLEKGFAQGFDRYRNLVEEPGPARTDLLVTAAELVLQKETERKRFLFFQTSGLRLPHVPADRSLAPFYSGAYEGPISTATMANPAALIEPLTAEDKRYLNALYDAELWEIDELLGRLIERLESTGEMNSTLVLVVGTHGEPLGEDAGLGYNNQLTMAELQVPVLVVLPNRLPAGERRRQRVELIDLFPTISELVGLAAPTGVQGESIVALLEGAGENISAPVFSQRGETHRSVTLGPIHYLLRSGDRDLLYCSQKGYGESADCREAAPIAHRAARDVLAIHLFQAEAWEKASWGSPLAPKEAAAELLNDRLW